MLSIDALEPIQTSDGTMTVRNRDLDVLYRSDEGAAGESKHVFVDGTQLRTLGPVIHVLELGFGTGQNFVSALHAAQASNASLVYHSVDYAPIHPDFCVQNHPTTSVLQELLRHCRASQASHTHRGQNYTLTLHPVDWRVAPIPNIEFDAIFHDPFDPKTNPTCWTTDVFEWEAKFLSDSGRIATYSAAGHVRRAMRDAGLYVARGDGFGRKREMSIAAKCVTTLQPLPIKYKP